ncbi:proline-rich protein 15-like [Astyanax mexicanus]|uniref:proline-rich protein 15-like n=1 Tax=Astyanax mexicanus TaxID=7994 RepID=UPI0020CAF94D|nr:proline-rich protein 15-like [Astyanax mexicanus]XP_049336605.1 proline-rich protein 15-like [Astyanax mexicanus]
MAERYPWWKSLTGRKKNNILKETVVQQEADNGEVKPSAKQGTESQNNSNLISHETYDDSQLEPVFNENTCRRNLRVSRSGRFKEKRRVRGTLPASGGFYETNTPQAVAK